MYLLRHVSGLLRPPCLTPAFQVYIYFYIYVYIHTYRMYRKPCAHAHATRSVPKTINRGRRHQGVSPLITINNHWLLSNNLIVFGGFPENQGTSRTRSTAWTSDGGDPLLGAPKSLWLSLGSSSQFYGSKNKHNWNNEIWLVLSTYGLLSKTKAARNGKWTVVFSTDCNL